MKWYVYAVICLGFSLAMLPSALRADGEQVMGEPTRCPHGMDLIRFSVGERMVAAVCMSPAELERATYSHGDDKGTIACRVVHVKAMVGDRK